MCEQVTNFSCSFSNYNAGCRTLQIHKKIWLDSKSDCQLPLKGKEEA